MEVDIQRGSDHLSEKRSTDECAAHGIDAVACEAYCEFVDKWA